jgi:hypothetical protein
MIERVDAKRFRLGVLADDQPHARCRRCAFAQVIHRAEFPGRVDMEQREGGRS